MNTLEYIVKKYNIDLKKKSPFHLICDRLVDLPLLFNELGFKIGAEIGVLAGKYSEILCKSNLKLKLYSIDAWKTYPIYKNFRRQWQYDAYYKEAKKRLAPYNCEIIKKWSMEAVKDFDDELLDFVFIDANHDFQFITNDIVEWGKKVRKGGVISGHDFGRSKRSTFVNVKGVVSAYTYEKRIHPWFVLNSPRSKHETSWMWVKE